LIRRELLPYAKRIVSQAPLDRSTLSKRLAGNETFVLTDKGLRIKGFVSCLIRDQSLNIDMIAVSRRSQGKGIGTRLMEYAESYGRSNGCKQAILFVDQPNKSAQQFYRQKGYIIQDY